eukprot:CAMPEP_0194212530 /NCGR_PEP_ID=MMETSP0156-20130528/12512_1 /TAXON_ID=33649 /ORGANISM="Thalassionema nitzschioides, Strain L26-B" /LENGTH=251 /DNA_ID=CAMNT_0038940375 /DNA_START=60 /DNA_END=815 /DNA_ORIENTATION=-
MSCSRRELIGWVGAATAFPSICNAVGDDGRVDVDSYLASGGVSMPMGVSGQAGKAKPVTGVILRDGSEVLRDTRTGDVSAEIIVSGPGGNTPVLASYSSPWSLAKGMVFDVECRDARTGDGAFLSVSQPVGGKNIDQLKDLFILTNLLKPNGRFSFYGEPTDVKVKASEMKGNYRIIDLSFSALSQATQTEIPRRARVAATIPEGSDQAVILVASASAIQWKKGSDKAIASTIESFRAVPAPRSDMKVRSK